MQQRAVKTFILFILSVLAAAIIYAKDAVGPDFLLINPHARTAAMNNCFVGIVDDTNSAFFNPAGLSFAKKDIIALTHFSSFADTNYEYLGLVFPRKGFSFGGAVLYGTVANFHTLDDTGSETGLVNNYDLLVSASCSMLLMPAISVGVSAKGFRSVFMEYSKAGFAVDAGVLMKISNNPDVYIGGALQNIGGQSAFIEKADILPLNLKLGLGYIYQVNEYFKITAAVDTNRILVVSNGADIGAGVELEFYKLFYLSVGLGVKQEASNLSAGAGIHINDLFRLSYAYQPFEDLGATHRLSLDLFIAEIWNRLK